MSLSQKEIKKIVQDRAYFDYYVDLNTGEAVESGIELIDPKDQNYIRFVFNEDTEKRIGKYLPRVLNQRGIMSPSDIEVNHPHVQAKINELKKSIGRNRRDVTSDETAKIVQMVRNAHQPQYITALMQVILWALIRADLFTIKKGNKGTELNIKLDGLEVNEEYWEIRFNSDDDELDEFIGDAWTLDFPPMDKSNPLEIMLAFATTILEKYPNIADTVSTLQSNVFITYGYSSGGVDYDDAGFLHSELDKLLRKPVVRVNEVKQLTNTEDGIRPATRAVESETIED